MASKQFFDPLTVLRVAPLVTSSFSVWYAWDQHAFLMPFLRPNVRPDADALLPSYFETVFWAGLPKIITLFTASTALGIANAVTKKPAAARLYAAGAFFSAAHFAFVFWVKGPVKAIVDDERKGKSSKDLERWLSIHDMRSLLVDFPGWVCFLLATLGAVKAL